ncbi:hypothetical protein CDO52_16565 [Nocardiopsis gilva YIM 90087]|uniref:EfeO-type cupredoxin-like domain-containing protein n=1 Tax=Nocardiopsis gilva YIM 90087 TaxID=1235441 RepID=A0A223S7U9_9ACTN|nr:cupredoxin domain-containing protein [Nocardiopsis gilva]ASU84188.1 hypothetical protein CDO52_16565 [Nocardiopsis gilva YIM 90087]
MSRLALSAAALAALLGLAACGGQEQEPTAEDTITTEQETEQDTGGGTAGDTEDTGEETPDDETTAETVPVKASEFSFAGIPDTLPAGTIKFDFDNVGQAQHNLVIEEIGDQKVVEAGPGEQASGTVDLEPGEYTIYCSIGNHREQGMETTVTVE